MTGQLKTFEQYNLQRFWGLNRPICCDADSRFWDPPFGLLHFFYRTRNTRRSYSLRSVVRLQFVFILSVGFPQGQVSVGNIPFFTLYILYMFAFTHLCPFLTQ